MVTKEKPVGAAGASIPQLEELMARKGLTQEDLSSAECYYASDDGEVLVVEYPSRWQHSRVPGAPASTELGESSMRDGGRALVVTW